MARVRSPQDVVGGLALAVVAAVAWSQMGELKMGTAMRMGPGYFPTVLSWLVGLFGLFIAARGVVHAGPPLDRWGWRHIIPVIGAIVLFAFAIRPLGLVLSGAGIVLVASFAAPDLRWRETILFGGALVLFTVLLFKVALGLPFAVWPRL